MNDWVYLTHCPMCKGSADNAAPVFMNSKQFDTVERYGLEIPVSFAVDYRRCYHCGLIYQNPRLTDEARERFYTDGLYRSFTGQGDYEPERRRADRLVSLVKTLDVQSVLDIGCGHGEFMNACQVEGIEAVGVDVIDYAMDGLKVYPLLDDAGGPYDMVSMLHYLEHISDPIAELKRAKLYSSKYVMVEVPIVNPADYTKHYYNIQHTLIFEPWILALAFVMAGLRVHGSIATDTFCVMVGEVLNE